MKRRFVPGSWPRRCVAGSAPRPQAAVSGAAPVKGRLPLLITNAGQGPGAKMSRLLVQRTGAVTDFDYNAEPKPADLQKKPYKTMMVVLGSTAKGLGASGITIDQEIERLNAMIAEAKQAEDPDRRASCSRARRGAASRAAPTSAASTPSRPFAQLPRRQEGRQRGRPLRRHREEDGRAAHDHRRRDGLRRGREGDVRASEHVRRRPPTRWRRWSSPSRVSSWRLRVARAVDGGHGAWSARWWPASASRRTCSSRARSPSSTSPSSSSPPACS